jgi:hypothetical protein
VYGDAVEAASDNRPHGWLGRLSIVWWLLTMLGCLALVRAPWMPWTTISAGAATISINGFNAVADESIFPGIGTDTAQIGSQDDGTVPDLPNLSSIPPTSGGADANARGGIFVLVPGATALFIALWIVGGEIERRRSMARIVLVLGGLTTIPLLRDLFGTAQTSNEYGSTTVGTGIIVGLAGAAVTMIGSGLLYVAIRRRPQNSHQIG